MMNKSVLIAGAGLMGASLAQVYAQEAYEVTLYNGSESGLERAKRLIALNQETLCKEEFLTLAQSEALQANIVYTTDKQCFTSASLVVEAIVEDMDIKKAFWSEISRLVPPDALLATNTSGMLISEIATAVYNPERFMGQHWLNPPHLLPLCEIISGEKTSQESVQAMYDLVKALGKQPIIVKKDVNGFVLNRLQYAVLREALYIVENGIADYEDVDTVFKAGLGLRYAAVGPFKVVDFGGVDTFNRINKYLFSELSNRPDGHPYLEELVQQGRFGVKSGAGFYDYSGEKADLAIRQRDELYIALAKVLYHGDK